MVVVQYLTELKSFCLCVRKRQRKCKVLRMLFDLQHKTNWGVEVYLLAVSASALDDGEWSSVSFTPHLLYSWGGRAVWALEPLRTL